MGKPICPICGRPVRRDATTEQLWGSHRTGWYCDIHKSVVPTVDGKGEGAMKETYRAALDAWYAKGSADSADALAEIENEVCAALDIPLNETEQGLTPTAEAIIRAWLAA